MDSDRRLYFIPGSSLKGMLRATMEIMSFGKMQQYTNRFFSKRELGGKHTPDGEAYVALMKGVWQGWLRMDGEKLFLTPSDGALERVCDRLFLQQNIIEEEQERYNREAEKSKRPKALLMFYELLGDLYDKF